MIDTATSLEEFEIEVKPIFRVYAPNGRKIWEGLDHDEARSQRNWCAAQARNIGVDGGGYTIKIRYEVIRTWIGEWEDWVPGE